MPELGQLQSRGIQIRPFQTIAPQEITPDTSAASKTAGRAALYGSIAKVLSDLPDQLISSYEKGRKLRVGNEVTKQYEEAKANPASGDLANFSATAEGDIKFAPQDAEERRLRLMLLGKQNTTLYDRINGQIPGATGAGVSSMQPTGATPAVEPALPLSSFQKNPSGAVPTSSDTLALMAPPDFAGEGAGAPSVALEGMQPDPNLKPASVPPAGPETMTPAKPSAVTAEATEPPLPEKDKPGVTRMADGTIIETFPGGKKRALSPRDPNNWVDISEKQSATENAVDRRIIALGANPDDMTPEQKTAYLSKQVPLKPSEKLTATRDLRTTFQNMPSTTLLFGKGQLPGLDGILDKLETIKKDSGGDFSKMSPQQGRTVVFSFSKFNDPTSAVLLSEYKAAADTLSLPDKLFQILNKQWTGESVTPEQARDIYNTIKSAHTAAKTNFIDDAADVAQLANEIGVVPRRIGIPAKAERWMNEKGATAPNSETSPTPVEEAPAAAPTDKGKSRDNPLPVDSDAAYASAPSGTWVIDSQGNIGKKP